MPNTIKPPVIKGEVELQWITDVMYGHLHGVVEDRWGNPHRNQHALLISDGAKMRIGSILGWILALSQSPDPDAKEFAHKAAKDFVDQMDSLNTYGGLISDENQTTNYRVCLRDDGTLHGFSLLWLANVPLNKADEIENRNTEGDRTNLHNQVTHKYAFSFNGGLLYHGPGQGEIYSVSLSDRLWSVHT